MTSFKVFLSIKYHSIYELVTIEGRDSFRLNVILKCGPLSAFCVYVKYAYVYVCICVYIVVTRNK